MSQTIGHFAVGIVVVFLMGLFAMVPDFPKLLNESDSHLWVTLSSTINNLHDTFWANIFVFHNALDKLDPMDTTLYSSIFIGIALILMGIYYKQLHKNKF